MADLLDRNQDFTACLLRKVLAPMSMRIHCPSCDHAFTCSDDKEGKKVTCPSCEQRFVAERDTRIKATPPKPVGVGRSRRDDDDDEPPSRSKLPLKKKQGGGGGLFLILGGVCALGLVGVLIVSGILAFVFMRDRGAPVGTS